MLAKLEIALLTVTVLGTLAASLAASLAGPHRSLATPSYHEQSIECSVPASAFRGVSRPSAKRKYCSIKYRGCFKRFRKFREWNRVRQTSYGPLESKLWHKCSTR
jgi:hypothetical protein